MASYILTYDVSTSFRIHDHLTAFVKANRHVTQWAQPFMGCFLLKSDTGILPLNASFAEFFGGKTLYMIAVVNPEQTAGLLPQAIWTWFNQPDLPRLGGALGQYLGIAPLSDQ
jgi:hypothetical protein